MRVLEGMLGLGDNIYQRAVVRELPAPVFLKTAWPELYDDIGTQCVRPSTRLRTQAKNVERSAYVWVKAPAPVGRRLNYAGRSGTILQALCLSAGVKRSALTFDLPAFDIPAREPYIVVRPATIRKEWPAGSRNAKPEYIAQAVSRLRRSFRIVSIADLMDGEEWPVGDLPQADEIYHHGELSVSQMLGLVRGASGVVGGVGWAVPAAVAYRVPMFLIYGGWGLHNGPQRIFDVRMDTSRITQVLPDRFCMCGTPVHGCNKTISKFEEQLEHWAIRLATQQPAAMAA